MTKYACLSKHFDQSEKAKLNSEPEHSKTREQTAITCPDQSTKSSLNSITAQNILNMNAKSSIIWKSSTHLQKREIVKFDHPLEKHRQTQRAPNILRPLEEVIQAVQYKKLGHIQEVDANDPIYWDLGNAV